MALTLTGVVESIIPKEKEGKVYARMYQVKVEGQGGYKKIINIDDFELNRKIEVGREVTLPVYCNIWQPISKNGEKKAPVLQYHAIRENIQLPNKNMKAA